MTHVKEEKESEKKEKEKRNHTSEVKLNEDNNQQ